uniref:TORTIFOLIA1/SINE1-2 N-terminal domain-containing protein n=1 Tax=Ananas comosus var. bracteatus TaxID=296719 RepID=A0A6V7P7V1_ANACO|nr:unnamed protein product [Ananas comosus var. bracteatus]
MGTSKSEGTKQRVNRCLSKMSDRDTEAMAASELESMARALAPDALPAFVSAISDARPTDRAALRRHSLRVLALLPASHPAEAVAPLLPRMLSAALRRLRDPDSSVRGACVDAVRSVAAAAAAAGAAPQVCAQLAAALCLAAAVDASDPGDPDLARHLQRLLPRLVKLLRSNAFKAKPALLSLLGSAAAAGGAATPALAGLLVPCLVDSLASEDWAARKAASEALTLLALSRKDLLAGFRSSCISSFESRRFDKVKIVRDSMNRMLEVWKEIPPAADSNSNAIPPTTKSQSDPSNLGSASDGRSLNASQSLKSVQSSSPLVTRKSRFSSSRSPPPDASPIVTARKTNGSIRSKILSPPLSRKMDHTKTSEWRVEIAVGNTPVKAVTEEKLFKDHEQVGKDGNVRSRLEARRMLFSEEKGSKSAGLRSGARVVPFQENGSLELTAGTDNMSDEAHEGHRDGDLSLIRRQLVQIENQQSSLLDLLQKFIGSSQNGMHSLETRVHGMEMALDEISRT